MPIREEKCVRWFSCLAVAATFAVPALCSIACSGANPRHGGVDPAGNSNATNTPGGVELGEMGSSNDLRPNENGGSSRFVGGPASAFAIDVVPPRGPKIVGPVSTPGRPIGSTDPPHGPVAH